MSSCFSEKVYKNMRIEFTFNAKVWLCRAPEYSKQVIGSGKTRKEAQETALPVLRQVIDKKCSELGFRAYMNWFTAWLEVLECQK